MEKLRPQNDVNGRLEMSTASQASRARRTKVAACEAELGRDAPMVKVVPKRKVLSGSRVVSSTRLTSLFSHLTRRTLTSPSCPFVFTLRLRRCLHFRRHDVAATGAEE